MKTSALLAEIGKAGEKSEQKEMKEELLTKQSCVERKTWETGTLG